MTRITKGSPAYAKMMLLKEQGCSYREIAEVLGTTQDAINCHMYAQRHAKLGVKLPSDLNDVLHRQAKKRKMTRTELARRILEQVLEEASLIKAILDD